jgi:PadR family transcriptional regulator PadR
MTASKITSDLLRGNTDTMILRLLAESDCYGYENVKLIGIEAGQQSENLQHRYAARSRLQRANAIGAVGRANRGAALRKYFRITDKGRATTPGKATGSTRKPCSLTTVRNE